MPSAQLAYAMASPVQQVPLSIFSITQSSKPPPPHHKFKWPLPQDGVRISIRPRARTSGALGYLKSA